MKILWKKPVGKPRLRWEHNFALLLNIRGWKRQVGDGDIWSRNVEEIWT